MNRLQLFLASLDFLDWCLLGGLLAIADVFLPRRKLLSSAIAAGITAFLAMLFPQLPGGAQLALFAALAGAAVGAYRWRHGRQAPRRTQMTDFHDFSLKMIDGRSMPTQDYEGSVVLVVNVASECGLTPQYAGLEKLFREFKGRRFLVLGIPCNQFGAQEPGGESEIKKFCEVNYGVSFLLASKVEVNGPSAHPLYGWLKSATGGEDIQWNFEKFLIGKDGRIVKRYSPKTVPEDKSLRADIQSAL
jgi:glutathione peroxidase